MPLPDSYKPVHAVRFRREARPLLRLTRPGEGAYFWIHKGKQGSLQTAYQMARLVREDVIRDEGLQRFAAQLLINAGLDSHSDKRVVATTVCEYVQGIPYIYDPSGSFDSISSARQTISKGFGDCDDLAVLVATLLALVGFEPRFVLARFNPSSKGYDHVYVDVVLPDGRMPLDPCSRLHRPGWESPKSYERLTYPIFAFPTTSLGDAMSLITTGASVGLNFVPGVGPILSSIVGPIAGLFSRKQQRAEETARDEFKDQLLRAMEQVEAAVNSCRVTREQGQAMAKELIAQFYKACDQFTKKSVGQSCRNFETQDVPGGPQEGNIRTHEARIAAAGGNCRLQTSGPSGAIGAGSGASGGSSSSLSIGGGSFPIWILLAGGAALFLLSRK